MDAPIKKFCANIDIQFFIMTSAYMDTDTENLEVLVFIPCFKLMTINYTILKEM